MGLTASSAARALTVGRVAPGRRSSLLTAASMLSDISSAVVPDSEYCIDVFTICTVTKLGPGTRGRSV